MRVKYVGLAIANNAYLHFTRHMTYEPDRSPHSMKFDDDVWMNCEARSMVLQVDKDRVVNVYLHLFKEVPHLGELQDSIDTVYFKKDTSSFPTPESYFALQDLQDRYPDLKYANLETGEIYRRSDEYYYS